MPSRENARQLWEKLSVQVPADLITAATIWGQDADLEKISKEIMAQSPA